MREKEIIAFRQDESIIDKTLAGVVRIVDEVTQQSQRETLADDRGGLKCTAVGSLKPIHARQNKALDGRRHGICGALLRIAQQLLQEQRVAAGALDADRGNA